MKNIFQFLFIFCCFHNSFSQEIQSPKQKLGYELGEKFTFHHEVVDYFKHLSEASEQMILHQYGETYEGRPLLYAAISTQENIEKLKEIQSKNLSQTGLSEKQAEEAEVAIVWLSFNIHGNEASSTEASMKLAYELLSGGMNSSEWLKNTVVIIDPCVNPDGRDRYANFYRRYGAKDFNPNLDAVEHHEPWPGGRPNHYLFDLNRDWAWQTQQESKARMKVYHEWMPHIHVDFHEQSINSPYYFAPAAEPLHEVITDWQKKFQVEIGKNHAKYFDKNNWLYFTRERFDLFYPSYGDTYPTFNGAIGMTYEQAGNGSAGLGALTNLNDTLTLKDRLEHHFTTGMSTIEIASKNAERLNTEFRDYFSRNINNPLDPYQSYIVKWSEGRKSDIEALVDFLKDQKIEVGQIGQVQNLEGYSYFQRKEMKFRSSPEDLVISSFQAKSTLIQALFDPKPEYSDSLTYDITAWAIPYAYGLETFALSSKVKAKSYTSSDEEIDDLESAYAYAVKWESFNSVQFLSEALKQGIKIRVAHKDLSFDNESFQRGSLIITQTNNETVKDLPRELDAIAKSLQVKVHPISTGFADQIYDVGSSEISYAKAPKIAVMMGEGVSSLAYGELWYYFERALDYPISSVLLSDIDYVVHSNYDIIVLPSGSYQAWSEEEIKSLKNFASKGGKVIAMGSALSLFADSEVASLKLKEEKEVDQSLLSYENAERERLTTSIFGAIYDVKMDQTHPLSYGMQKQYFSLKTSATAYQYLENAWNVGIINSDNRHVAGFAGFRAREQQVNSMVFGVEAMGRGEIVYLQDDPLFRAFWYQGKMLMANALFMVGND